MHVQGLLTALAPEWSLSDMCLSVADKPEKMCKCAAAMGAGVRQFSFCDKGSLLFLVHSALRRVLHLIYRHVCRLLMCFHVGRQLALLAEGCFAHMTDVQRLLREAGYVVVKLVHRLDKGVRC